MKSADVGTLSFSHKLLLLLLLLIIKDKNHGVKVQQLRCHVGHLHPIWKCLGLTSGSTSDASYPLMCALGGHRDSSITWAKCCLNFLYSLTCLSHSHPGRLVWLLSAVFHSMEELMFLLKRMTKVWHVELLKMGNLSACQRLCECECVCAFLFKGHAKLSTWKLGCYRFIWVPLAIACIDQARWFCEASVAHWPDPLCPMCCVRDCLTLLPVRSVTSN